MIRIEENNIYFILYKTNARTAYITNQISLYKYTGAYRASMLGMRTGGMTPSMSKMFSKISVWIVQYPALLWGKNAILTHELAYQRALFFCIHTSTIWYLFLPLPDHLLSFRYSMSFKLKILQAKATSSLSYNYSVKNGETCVQVIQE